MSDRAPLPADVQRAWPDLADRTLVATSATTGEGVADLVGAIRVAAGDVGADELVMVTSERQATLLAQSATLLESAASGLRLVAPPELVAVDLRAALTRLGEITGETFDTEVLDRLFARFCIGK